MRGRDDAQVGADGQVTQMDDSVTDKNKGRWMRSQKKGGAAATTQLSAGLRIQEGLNYRRELVLVSTPNYTALLVRHN